MLRATDDILQLRHWAETRGGRPCRQLDGRLMIAFPDEPCRGAQVGWDEFEPTFCLGKCVFVYDDCAESRQHFIGGEQEARDYFAQVAGSGQPPAPPEP